MLGAAGRIGWVDLGSRTVRVENPTDEVYAEYLGGYGLGVRYVLERQPRGLNAFDPRTILGFTTGLLVGTPAITASRFTVVGKSPLTGTWGDANAGGFFGPALKDGGFDALFFTGAAAEPVYVLVEDGNLQVRDAPDLWGLDTTETEDVLKERHGQGCQVASIGQAGERLNLIAGVMHDKGRAAARSGLGALMGSKRLKAVVVLAGSGKVPIDEPGSARKVRRDLVRELVKEPTFQHRRKYGTVDHIANSAVIGDSPVKNWSGYGSRDFPGADRISDDAVLAYETKKYGCWQCVWACGGIYDVAEGPHAVEDAHKPEYETFGMLGTNLLNDDVESIILVNDLCNRYGLDTISTGSVIGFAMECYERGFIDSQDTGGLELTWGNEEAVVELVRQIGERTGFGAVLADGARSAAAAIGQGSSEFVMAVRGQELPAHDPRLFPSWGLYYAVDATPGRHTQIGVVPYERGGGYPGLELPVKLERYEQEGKGKWAAKVQNIQHALHCAGICMFALSRVPIQRWCDFLELVTGESWSLDRLEELGARVAALRQVFNVREGVQVGALDIPRRAYGYPPATEGPLAGITIPVEDMARDYYAAQGWDYKGRPTPERLQELGIGWAL